MTKNLSFDKLRYTKQLKGQWLRLYRLGVRCGCDAAFSGISQRLFANLFGNQRVQKQLFPSQVDLIHRFLIAIDSAHEPSQVVQQNILETTLLRWRYQDATMYSSSQALERHFVVENWHLFEQAHETGHGVLFALSHYGLSRALINYMRARGYDGVTIRLCMGRRLRAADEAVSPLNKMLMSARDLAAAHQALEMGGIAHIVPDGTRGRATIVYPFFDRRRHFRTGFAELALATGAITLPATAIPHLNGKVHIKFFEPFDSGTHEMGHEARMRQLIAQYADHLTDIWTTSPGSVLVGHMQRFLYDAETYELPNADG